MLTWNEIDPADTCHPLMPYQVIRRNGALEPFEPNRIASALEKAFEGMKKALQHMKDVFASISHIVEAYRCSKLQFAGNWIVAFISLHMYQLPMRPLVCSRVVHVARTRLSGFFWSGKVNLRNAP